MTYLHSARIAIVFASMLLSVMSPVHASEPLESPALPVGTFGAAGYFISLGEAPAPKGHAVEQPLPQLILQRNYHSATPMEDGSILIVGGEDVEQDAGQVPLLNSVVLVRNGVAEPQDSLHVARKVHSSTRLTNGAVLVVGGIGINGQVLAAVEIWEPTTLKWRAVPELHTPRYSHSATLLSDGRVMIAGGTGQNGEIISSVEIWDPASNKWNDGASLLLPLHHHEAALLSSGDVLVAGGWTLYEETSPIAMVWNQAIGQWLPAGDIDIATSAQHAFSIEPQQDGSALLIVDKLTLKWLPENSTVRYLSPYGGRSEYRTTLTRDGRVLITGGLLRRTPVDWAEIYDPVTGRFTVTGRMHNARHSHSATALDDGRVVIAGALVHSSSMEPQSIASTPEVWDPQTGRWKTIEQIRFEVNERVELNKLSDGRVLFFVSKEYDDLEQHQAIEFKAWLWDPSNEKVERKSVDVVPRRNAGIAVLPDGSVLIVGGFARNAVPEVRCEPQPREPAKLSPDGAEYEDDRYGCIPQSASWEWTHHFSADLWDSKSGTVTRINHPGQQLSYIFETSVTTSGNVLMLGNIGGYQTPLVARWNKTHDWIFLPEVRNTPSWPVVELHDGTMIAPHRRLKPGATAWEESPPFSRYNANLIPLASGELLILSTSQPHVVKYDAQSNSWQPLTDSYLKRSEVPAIVTLKDGRVVISGPVAGMAIGTALAQVWDPVNNVWTTSQASTSNGKQVGTLLASGRVMFVSEGASQKITCEILSPDDGRWSDCGCFKRADKYFALDSLADGRTALMLEKYKAHIYDEATNTWDASLVEWSKERIAYGAPVRLSEALAHVYDAKNKEWIDADVLAGKFQRGGVKLWDPNNHHWAYIFTNMDTMNTNAVWLPDGCAISWPPFSIFNPTTGKATHYVKPVVGMRSYDSTLAALNDGTVILVGKSMGTSSAQADFLRFKASCQGFEGGVTVADKKPPPVRAAKPVVQMTLMQKIQALPPQAFWVPVAILVPLILYFILRRFMNWAVVKSGGVLGREVPGWIVWTMRAVVFGSAVFVFWGADSTNAPPQSAAIIAECKATPGCTAGAEGIVASLIKKAKESFKSGETIPCLYVGVWQYRKAETSYRIRLEDNGSYLVESSIDGTENHRKSESGTWSVKGKNMLWRPSHVKNFTDSNAIITNEEGMFILVEANGSTTRFERIARTEYHHCSH